MSDTVISAMIEKARNRLHEGLHTSEEEALLAKKLLELKIDELRLYCREYDIKCALNRKVTMVNAILKVCDKSAISIK
jgi:hypothetical protein